jgi:hypothetical protein
LLRFFFFFYRLHSARPTRPAATKTVATSQAGEHIQNHPCGLSTHDAPLLPNRPRVLSIPVRVSISLLHPPSRHPSLLLSLVWAAAACPPSSSIAKPSSPGTEGGACRTAFPSFFQKKGPTLSLPFFLHSFPPQNEEEETILLARSLAPLHLSLSHCCMP